MNKPPAGREPVLHTDVAILGAGTAGLRALAEVRRARRRFLLIDPGPLGTTCARVGCMPSKAALQIAGTFAARHRMASLGVEGVDALRLDRDRAWAEVRRWRDHFAGDAERETRRVAAAGLLGGCARFVAPTRLEVRWADGSSRQVEAAAIVIATGTRPHVPEAYTALDPARVWTTDTLFEQTTLPPRIGVIGLGAIGVEMGVALARLGVAVTLAGRGQRLAGVEDEAVSAAAVARLRQELDLWLDAEPAATKRGDGLRLSTADGRQADVDALLLATGRIADFGALGLAEAGFEMDARGRPVHDPGSLQLAGGHPVYLAGDVDGQRTVLHEATDDGAIAGWNAARLASQRFERRTALGIAFTSPDLAQVGTRWTELKGRDDVLIGEAGGERNGRSVIVGERGALLRVYAQAGTGRVLGASLLMPGGEHLAHLLAWSIQRGETVHDMLEKPFYHPVVEELLRKVLNGLRAQLPTPAHGLPPGLRPATEPIVSTQGVSP